MYKNSFLCLVAAAALTACGGSSSSNNNTTPPPGKEVVALEVANGGGTGVYVSQAGTDPAEETTVVTLGGAEATQFSGYTITSYGSTALEAQYSIPDDPTPGTIDLSTHSFTLTYDLWLDSTSNSKATGMQASAWTGGYAPKYWNTGGGDMTKTDQWQTISVTLDPAADGYKSDSWDATTIKYIRIKIVTSEESDVLFAIKNIKIAAPE